MIKIAVLYIALGKYMIFWSSFYESAEKNFLPDIPKEYFVFTNHKTFKYSDRENVHVIHEEMKPWPHATLSRYDFFLKIEDQLSKFDYLFFFNANALIVGPIYDEILPKKKHCWLVCAMQPWFVKTKRENLPFESRPESTAYISPQTHAIYLWGAINGGTADAFLRMSKRIARNTRVDAEHGITAIWHDESHLNKYMLRILPLLLGVRYGMPEEMGRKIPIKILLRDKRKYGGTYHLRSVGDCENLIFFHPFHIPW